jgi:hypothetical protein
VALIPSLFLVRDAGDRELSDQRQATVLPERGSLIRPPPPARADDYREIARVSYGMRDCVSFGTHDNKEDDDG